MTERDVIALPPGRYIVVAVVNRGTFEKVHRNVQVVIERDRVTTVDVLTAA